MDTGSGTPDVPARSGGRRADYLFLLAGGALGAFFGGIHDGLVSFPLSPEYFSVGKELGEGYGLHGQAILLGLGAGIAPGVIGAAVILYLGRKAGLGAALAHPEIARQFAYPLIAAIVVEAIFALVLSDRDPMRFRPFLAAVGVVDRSADRFLLVWWMHVGVYAGFGIGLAVAAIRLALSRRR